MKVCRNCIYCERFISSEAVKPAFWNLWMASDEVWSERCTHDETRSPLTGEKESTFHARIVCGGGFYEEK